MQKNRTTQFLFFVVFFLSTLLRVTLAIVNREANDNHLEVVGIIMQEKRLPGIDDCLECFHPKLFHYILALIFETLGLEVNDVTSQTILAQLLNAGLGTILILIIWNFLQSLSIENDSLRLIAFSLIAFNPNLIGINAQVTNDTLAILFATLAIYSTCLFLKQERGIQFLAGILSISLGIATKTNIFVTAFAILFALFVKAFAKQQRVMFYSAALFLPIVLTLSFFNPLTQYRTNYQNFGSAVGMNKPKQPFPAFFEKSYVVRPGIVSIQDGIFTFKFINLIEYPRLTNNAEGYPAHRTSLWTQIYAHANSVHFDNWPISWSTKGNENFPLTRAIYLLALLPFAMILLGAVVSLVEFLQILFGNFASSLGRVDYGLFDALFWSHVAFIILYALQFRDFSMMKAIFVYPAVLAFAVLFIKSGSAIQRNPREKKWFLATLSFVVTVLVILYSMDIYTLSKHLYLLL
jgi:Dolichyl-phosphate-mannose-protein mannosyltransferase